MCSIVERYPRFFLSVLLLLVVLIVNVQSLATPITRIEVCQNKDCCRRFRSPTNSLYQVLQLLNTPAQALTIESTGCLSQCDKGPNLLVWGASSQVQRVINGVADATQAAAQLEALSIEVPSQLLAAVTVMHRAEQASSWTEKQTLLNSVVRVLNSDVILKDSVACLRAHALRAEAALQEGLKLEALNDINDAIAVFEAGQSRSSNNGSVFIAQAFRVAADCYESLEEYEKAIECIGKWASLDNSYKVKATKEIDRIKKQRFARS